jgi:preprotein translocase subunit YajC
MFISPAYAQAASGAAAPDAIGGLVNTVGPMVLIFVVFWFLIFRPQQQRAKAHAAKLAAVKKGDQVVTGGGLMGKVIKVDTDTVEVEIAPNVRVKAVKTTLTDVVTNTPGKAAND